MSTEIKNTLFRFVSMRAPELVENTKQSDRFIFRSDNIIKGSFDTAISNMQEGASKWQTLKTASETFEPLTVDQIKALDTKLYDFSVWAAKNRNFFSETDLDIKREGVTAIEDTKILGQLWDNLFYQTITQKEFYAKEVIIQLLTANHFITNYKASNFDHAQVLLNAKIVLPKLLFVDDKVDINTSAKTSNASSVVSTVPSDLMVKQQHIAQAELENSQLKSLSKSLQKVKKGYQKEYALALEIAEKEYQKTVKPLLDQYQKDVEASKKEWCSVKDPNITYDPNDPCQQPPRVTEPELPDFDFSFRKQLDYTYLQSKLNEQDFQTLTTLLAKDNSQDLDTARVIDEPSFNTLSDAYDGFTDIDDIINNTTSDNNQIISDNSEDEANVSVNIGGIHVPVDNSNTDPDFSFQLCSKPAFKTVFVNPKTYNSDLSIVVPDSSWAVSSFDYTVERTDANYSNNGQLSYFPAQIGNNIILKNINIGAPQLSEEVNLISFSGTVTFTNGIVKTFVVPEFKLTACASGLLEGTVLDAGNDDDLENPSTNNETPFIPSGFGVKQLGIADYNKVEQTTQGYIEGDVAHIENIMAREFKERSTRRLRRKEDTFTSSSETEKEQLTDTTSATRFEMQNEVANVITSSKDVSAGTNFQASYGFGGSNSIQLGLNASYATHNSKEQSTLQAVTNAKDVTERALDRIVSKVKEERVEKIVEEFEENNTHGFDNRKGDKHVVGVFRWVDKVFKNQIINYGKRLMFEFMIPQPGKLHKLGMKDIAKNDENILTEPIDPRTATSFNLNDFSKISEATVKHWSSVYNVEIEAKPKEFIEISKSFDGRDPAFGGKDDGKIQIVSGNGEINIPENYAVEKADYVFGTYPHNFNGLHQAYVTIGGQSSNWIVGPSNTMKSGTINGLNVHNKLSYSFATGESPIVSGTIKAKCQLTDEAKQKWQQDTFRAIITAYEDALADYNDKVAQQKAQGIEIKGTNPGFYREFENKILRKNCISYLIDQNPDAKNTYGKSNLFKPANGVEQTFTNTEVKVNAALDNYAAFVKFMEQAFEWDIMSYNLYPYYWGNRKDWSSLYQYDESNDPLFRNFMQAGMARVVVTVRPGFEEAVRYYMQTGQIWNGGEVPVIEDELYLSLVDELRAPKGEKLGKAWPTRVPTALTILQAQSIGLKVDKALPFNEDLGDFENPEEVPQSSQLELNDAEIGISEDDGQRHIENIDIVNGNLQLNTDDSPRQTVAQISIQALKNAIDTIA